MKKIFCITLVIFLIFSIQISSFSYENINDIWESIDDTTKNYLEELNIDEITFDELFAMTPTRVMEFIFSLAFDKTESVFEILVLIFITMIISAIAASFLNENKQLIKIIDYISILIIISFIINSLSRILTDAATGIQTSNIFINTYLPVMAGIIVASRNPALAVTYNSFTIFLSSIISIVSDKLLVPVASIILSFSILSTFSDDEFYVKITKILRKIIIISLSLFSTVYTGSLSAQSILASSTDTLALKGIKFVSGAFIPVVGGNVSDAISSAISSFILMKNSLGIFIIIVIILINLPVMIELIVWYIILSFCSIFSSLLKLDAITNTFECLASTVSLLNIILFFITFVLVVSTGVIITMGK